MEGEAKPVIVPKTQEQLKQQTNLTNLHQAVKYKEPVELPQEFLTDPKGFQSGLKEYRDNQKVFSKEDNSPQLPNDEPYRKYEAYVKALRELRRYQYTHLEASRRSDSISPRENHLEAARFSPYLADDVLRIMNSSLKRSEMPEFTDEQRQKASSSEKDFQEAVNMVINKKPQVFYENIKFLKHVVDLEKAREIVLKQGGNDYYFLAHYSDVKHLLTTDEQKNLLIPYIEKAEYPWLMVNLFKDPDAARLFSPEKVKQAVDVGLKYDHDDLSKENVEFYLQKEIINPTDVQNIIIERIKEFKPIKSIQDLVAFLPSQASLEEIKKEIVETYTTKAEAWNLIPLVHLADILEPAERTQIVRTVVLRDLNGAANYISSFEQLLQPEDLRPLLQEYITASNLEFEARGLSELFKTNALTSEDKEKLFNQVVDAGKTDLFIQHFDDNINQIPEEQKAEAVTKVISSATPKELASNFSKWERFASKEDLQVAVDRAKIDFEAVSYMIGDISIWGPKLGSEYTTNYLKQYQHTHAMDILFSLNTVYSYIPENERKEFVSSLIKTSPLGAIYAPQESPEIAKILVDMGFDIAPQSIVTDTLQAEAAFLYAPKLLKEFYKQFSPDKSYEEQKALVTEALLLYKSIAFIQFHELGQDLQRLQSGVNLSASGEKDLISTLYCFSVLKDSSPEQFAEIESLGATAEESKQILFNQLSLLLGEGKQYAPEEVSRFFGTMESPIPFMVYLLQYKDSPPHKEMLTQIFNSITQGKFKEWKYGEQTPETVEQLKLAGLIPEKLTFEQYSLWQTDGQTTLFESLATDTQTTANAVRGYLEGNLNHLEIQGVLDHLINTYPNQDLMVGLQQDLASIGQQLAAANKELTALRKQEGGDSQRIGELEQTKASLENNRKNLVRARKVFRIINIRADEVASGFFLEGKDSKQRGESVEKVLTELKESSANENAFAYDEVKNMLDSLRNSSYEKQNLVCTDSSDPKIWIEIGEKPVASCQSYDHGGYNECLVAYTDPNTKILALRNEKGNVVARSIFRLLQTSQGNPALHIERIYSASTSKGILRSMFSRSYQKAQEMGLPLLVSEQSQDEEGLEQEAQLAEGYQLGKVDYTLVSKASRAPKVYVDSAGGVSYGGQFEIKDLVEVHKI